MKIRFLSAALVFACFAALCGPASADPEELSERRIAELFPRIQIIGNGGYQAFQADGTTISKSDSGASRLGYWTIKNGQYCSNWPPSTAESCYTVWLDGEELTFVSYDGRRSTYQVLYAGAQPAPNYLTSKQISLLLPKIVARAANGATQTFDPGGDTRYVYPGGATSTGRWSVENGHYCSRWSSGKSCYRVLRDGDTLIFVDSAGQRTAYAISRR